MARVWWGVRFLALVGCMLAGVLCFIRGASNGDDLLLVFGGLMFFAASVTLKRQRAAVQ